MKYTDPTGHRECEDPDTCNTSANPANLLKASQYYRDFANQWMLAHAGQKTPWEALDKSTQWLLEQGGYSQGAYQDALGGGLIDVGGTLEDPATYVMAAIPAARFGGPVVNWVGRTVTLGGASCLTNPVCGTVVFGVGSEAYYVSTSGGSQSATATVVRTIAAGENVDDLLEELKIATFNTGNEYAVVTLADGTRAIVTGGPGGIDFLGGQITRLFLHTHPYQLPALGPSDADYNALIALGQKSSWLLEHGDLIKFWIWNRGQ